MREFYTRLAAGVDKGKALRDAKLTMIQKFGRDATPRMWAGFIVVGESRGTLRFEVIVASEGLTGARNGVGPRQCSRDR